MTQNSLKLLIVDDSESSRQMMAEILDDYDAQLFFAENGIQLLALMEEQTFDMFIIDINMPDIDGITLTQKIRKNEQYTETPILIFTALMKDSLISKAFNAGASDYIHKPPSYFEVRARVTNLLHKFYAENRANKLIDEVRSRNEELIETNRELQSVIETLKDELIATKSKLNNQLISISESASKHSDLLAINYEMTEQIKQLHSKNIELEIMLDNKFSKHN